MSTGQRGTRRNAAQHDGSLTASWVPPHQDGSQTPGTLARAA
jgi:hypothetical protein